MPPPEDDLHAFEHLCRFDTELAARLCAASRSRDAQVLVTLQLSAIRPFAEFYFLLRAKRVTAVADIARLAEAHNRQINVLLEDASVGRPSRVKRRRLIEAIFTSDVLPRLLATWRERPGAIDQSNLGRFLAPTMSSETARKIALACERAGFLQRARTPLGTVTVQSIGMIEDVYGRCLQDLRAAMTRPPIVGT